MLGVTAASSNTAIKLINTLKAIRHTNAAAALVSLGVIVLVDGIRRLTRRNPVPLIAVVGAITMSHTVNLAGYRVGVLGAIPPALPHLATPSFALPELRLLLPTAVSTFVVILAQSSATSRAYAANYGEVVSEDLDLVGLTGANLFAVFTGTFVVNGNPTKTQMLDGAGGRSELSQLTASVVVLLVVLVLTGPLAYLPIAALVTVVFLIGVELIDVAGMRRIYTMRREEFGVAALTAVAVVFFGVEQGVLLAIVDHLRHSYDPRSSVVVKSLAGHWQSLPVAAGIRTTDGLLIYASTPAATSQRLQAGRRHYDPHPARRAASLAVPGRRSDRRRGLHRRRGPDPRAPTTTRTRHPPRAVQHRRTGPRSTGPLRNHHRSRSRRLLRHRPARPSTRSTTFNHQNTAPFSEEVELDVERPTR
jgi:hypothetical protein